MLGSGTFIIGYDMEALATVYYIATRERCPVATLITPHARTCRLRMMIGAK